LGLTLSRHAALARFLSGTPLGCFKANAGPQVRRPEIFARTLESRLEEPKPYE
jgi:hypothetical protein